MFHENYEDDNMSTNQIATKNQDLEKEGSQDSNSVVKGEISNNVHNQ